MNVVDKNSSGFPPKMCLPVESNSVFGVNGSKILHPQNGVHASQRCENMLFSLKNGCLTKKNWYRVKYYL